jgi:hypothetical protein
MAKLFRPQRGSLAEAMAEVREVKTRADIDAIHHGWHVVAVDPYGGIDKRIGWDTYIVTGRTADGQVDVYGFTDGPLDG